MKIKSFLTCIFLCAIFTTSRAQESDWLKEGDRLMQQGDYFHASVCYERVLFEGGNNAALLFNAVTGKLNCLKAEKKFAEADRFLKGILIPDFSNEQKFFLAEQRMLCAYLAGQFENCISQADLMKILFPSEYKSNLAAILRVLSYNELQQWKEAEQAWKEWAAAVDSMGLQNPYQNLPKFKSEEKAERLATFIPGAGQFYAGRPVEALIGILFQAAGVYYGVTSFLNHYYLSAWAGAGIFGSFHMGGVRRSKALVRGYNKKKMAAFNAMVRAQMTGK